MNTVHTPQPGVTDSHKGLTILNENVIVGSSSIKHKVICKHIKKGNIVIDHTCCPTPSNLKLELKLHQQRMLHEMIQKESLEYRVGNKLNMFVLSDKVGSGKSLDILALICKYPTLDDTKYLDINYINYKIPKMIKHFQGLKVQPTVIFKTNLIVIPHNIFNQWSSYIKDFTDLTAYYINCRKKIKTINYKDLIDGTYNIVLVKSTMYNDFMNNVYHHYPRKNKFKIINSEYADIYKLKSLTYDIENHISRSLYNLSDNNEQYIVNKFNTIKDLVKQVDIQSIIDTMNQSGQTINDILSYKGPLFERVIIDEANSIKIPSCILAYGKINWFITSSVEDLLHPWGKWDYSTGTQINGVIGSGFIKNTFTSNCHRYLLPSIQDMYLKNTDEFVKKSFDLPEPIKHIVKCWTPPELLVLKGIAAPEVIHALNAGDMASAIQMTHCNVSNETDIVDSTLNYLRQSLDKYTRLIEEKNNRKADIQLLLDSNDSLNDSMNGSMNDPVLDEEAVKESKKLIKNINVSLKNFSDKKNDLEYKIISLKERISNVKDKTCPICISTVVNPCLTDCCKNIFCMACYLQSLEYSNHKCPHCRATNRQISNVTLIHNELASTQPDETNTLPKKSEELIRIINSKPEGRFLVFSEYNNTFRNILTLLNENDIQYNKLSGSSGRITNIIRDYTENKTKVLLLNAKHYGSGLNLQMTTDIIIYHKMSADLENQVIGRGQRLGRTGTLHVHYLYYENEE